MTPDRPALRRLPARPSLDALRKQARKLLRAAAAGEAAALDRLRAQLPEFRPPPTHRDALLALAREYGFPGWQALREEVSRRLGRGLDWAALEAERAIHADDLDRLRQLLAEHPGLLAWQDEEGGTLLGAAVNSFGDSGDPARERTYTRAACAELLLDQGAVVAPGLWRNALNARAGGMLALLRRKGVLPACLLTHAALGELAAVRSCFDAAGAPRPEAAGGDPAAALAEAFHQAARLRQAEAAAFLLDRCIALDPALGRRVDGGPGRPGFIAYFGENPQDFGGPWRSFVVNEVLRTIGEDDLPGFARRLEEAPELLGEAGLPLQVELLERATLLDRGRFIEHLLGLRPALARCAPPPPSAAPVFALEYGHAHLVPLLTPIWPLPDDLPHAAGLGDLPRVRSWFDAEGRPQLGELRRHYPVNNPAARMNLRWGEGSVQQVLDVALAWACMNRKLEVAAFLVAHGADVNTDWSTHEPASILHECALYGNFAAAGFLIEHGADLAKRDHRWGATAAGWAWNAAKDEAMTAFLQQAEARRQG
ncbi:ankyrin repeat domain-containing protein [Siccirubricoccus phaeus]|uniref:ankyrin repeat domain-containing protein n=1 Tax=Siccirubricoccus phaeus TaxID=2595053 RepID=UPI0011F22517|nr:ankyrin repeat domain-containing protein [Siccirubricoccus phaeus]